MLILNKEITKTIYWIDYVIDICKDIGISTLQELTIYNDNLKKYQKRYFYEVLQKMRKEQFNDN